MFDWLIVSLLSRMTSQFYSVQYHSGSDSHVYIPLTDLSIYQVLEDIPLITSTVTHCIMIVLV